MDKDKIILKDGTILEIDQSSSTGEFCMTFSGLTDFGEVLNKLSPENLERYQVQNQAGLTVATPTDKECRCCRLDLHRDDSGSLKGITSTFTITDVDLAAKAIRELQAGQEVQDGAITEIAEMVAGGDV